MYKKRNKSLPAYFIPMLWLLFAFFVLGCTLGVFSTVRCGEEYTVSSTQTDGFLSVVWECLVYHIAVLAFIRFPLGAVFVLFVFFTRGYVLTTAVTVMYISDTASVYDIWKLCGLPALLQLPSLFYLAAMSLHIPIIRKMGRTMGVHEQSIRYIKRDLLCCGLSLLLCVAVECVKL